MGACRCHPGLQQRAGARARAAQEQRKQPLVVEGIHGLGGPGLLIEGVHTTMTGWVLRAFRASDTTLRPSG